VAGERGRVPLYPIAKKTIRAKANALIMLMGRGGVGGVKSTRKNTERFHCDVIIVCGGHYIIYLRWRSPIHRSVHPIVRRDNIILYRMCAGLDTPAPSSGR